MKRKTILLAIFSIILTGAIIWCVNAPYRKVNLNNNLETIQESESCIPARELYKNKDWDTMIVIKPHDKCTASDEGIDMGYTGDRAVVPGNILLDNICTLLFIKGDKLVAFLSIYCGVIDFGSLSKATYKTADKIQVINRFAVDC